MNDEKMLMFEAATLYYEKKLTQQEIADLMNLSRQTVSRLLNDAVAENIVEITVHDPEKTRKELEEALRNRFGIRRCVVCGVSGNDPMLHRMMTVKAAVDYLLPIIEKGGLKIAVSWGRTIQELIGALPEIATSGNVVFPLFGATNNETSYFSSNELARHMADKIGADLKYAWFPYLTESAEDIALLKKLSYYKTMQELWNAADVAVFGIGGAKILDVFESTFGYSEKRSQVVGDIATHFFNENGELVNVYENTLCASESNLKNAKEAIAVACGTDKAEAIVGALRTGMVNTLITDEHTARRVLELAR